MINIREMLEEEDRQAEAAFVAWLDETYPERSSDLWAEFGEGAHERAAAARQAERAARDVTTETGSES